MVALSTPLLGLMFWELCAVAQQGFAFYFTRGKAKSAITRTEPELKEKNIKGTKRKL